MPLATLAPVCLSACVPLTHCRYSLGFRLQKVYLQPVADFLVQAGTCVDVHCVAHILFWVLCGVVGGGLVSSCRVLHDAWHSMTYRCVAAHVLGAALAVLAVQATLLDLLARAR